MKRQAISSGCWLAKPDRRRAPSRPISAQRTNDFGVKNLCLVSRPFFNQRNDCKWGGRRQQKKLSSIIRPGQSDWVRFTVSQDRRHHSFKLSILRKLGHRHRCACREAIQSWPGARLDCVDAARLATTVRTSRARPASSTAHRKRFGELSRYHPVSFVT
jgi:hypothetical protein